MWRSTEETGAFMAATFIIKSGRHLLEQLHHDGRRTCQFQPEQSDYTARMAHVSHSEMRYGWLLPLLDLLQQLPRMVLRTTTNLLDQEDCYGISLLKKIRACNLRGY